MTFRSLLKEIAELVVGKRSRKPQLAAATLSAVVAVLPANAQSSVTTPRRPSTSSPKDTVRRYGEKFILLPSDSVVIRADTTWYPRKPDASGKKAAAPVPRSIGAIDSSTSRPTPKPSPPVKAPPLPPVRASGGGHGSHSSHSSHASHRSTLGLRNGY